MDLPKWSTLRCPSQSSGAVFTTFFVTYVCAQKAGVFYCARLERLVRFKHSSLLEPYVTKNINTVPETIFTPIYFLLKLTNETNKLECYITLGWKGLPWKNNLAYWTINTLR